MKNLILAIAVAGLLAFAGTASADYRGHRGVRQQGHYRQGYRAYGSGQHRGYYGGRYVSPRSFQGGYYGGYRGPYGYGAYPYGYHARPGFSFQLNLGR